MNWFQNAQGDGQADAAAKEALRYCSALHQDYRPLKERRLCTADAVEICRTLRGIDMSIRRIPDTQLANALTAIEK